ncbi:hypothetical protein F4861DRAFT_174432 [Xylaria intraflava]|nr:hypothetical protein F4861DRAFT_174432 [Xylaria intraflava]
MPILRLIKGAEKINPHIHDNGHLIYIPAWIFLFLCPVVVGTRIWSRKRTSGHLGPDDYTILASLTFAMVTDVITLWGCYYGYGKHVASLSEHQRYEAFKSFYLMQITYKTSINLTKSSILLLYLRIFGGVKWFRWTCCCVLALVASYCIAAILATVFQCIPVVAAFDKTITNKTCVNNGHFWFANAGFSILTDVVILVIPMPLVYALQIPRVQKIALVLVFALGVFVVITSCLRATTLDLQASSHDPLYDVASTMWTIIEMSLAIICACLPQIRHLVVKLLPGMILTYCNAKEKLGHEVKFGSSLMKPHDNHHQQAGESENNWSTIEFQDSINMTSIRKGSGSSGSRPTSEARKIGTGVEKTTHYSMEYSQHRKEAEL